MHWLREVVFTSPQSITGGPQLLMRARISVSVVEISKNYVKIGVPSARSCSRAQWLLCVNSSLLAKTPWALERGGCWFQWSPNPGFTVDG